MKGIGFGISLSNFSAAMAIFKTFGKLAYVKNFTFRLNFPSNLLMLRKIYVQKTLYDMENEKKCGTVYIQISCR